MRVCRIDLPASAVRSYTLPHPKGPPVDHPLSDSDVRRPLAPNAWRNLNAALEAWFRGHHEIWSQAHRLAEGIFDLIRWLDPFFERYERESYPLCAEPCCTARQVFFDRADLLFFHALPTAVPEAQTRAVEKQPCRYLTPQGCVLPRLTRPHVCNWFLCDLQYHCFTREPAKIQRDFLRYLEELRHHRLRLSLLYDPQTVF